jgi:beta-lactamase regulating signal transducer with metallopeptidase domain
MTGMDNPLAQPALQAVGWALLHFVWQGFCVAAVYAVVRVALRQRSSDARYTAACGAMVAMLVVAVATFAVFYAETATPSPAPAGPFESARLDPGPTPDLAPAATAPAREGVAASMRAWSRAWLEPALPWLTTVWLAGVTFLSLRFLGGLAVAHRLKRRFTAPVEPAWQDLVDRLSLRLGVERAVRLCESAAAEVPTVIGWLSPVILVPVGLLAGLSPAQVEAVLAHELAHVRRCDYLVNIVQTMVETLLFYHPAVWWVSRQVREERENCCDDLAVAACGDVLVYARALAELEDLRGAVPAGALAANGGSLVRRIERLLGRPSGGHYAPAYLTGVLAVIALGSLMAGARAADAPAKIVAAIAAVGLAPSNAESSTEPAATPAASRQQPNAGNAANAGSPVEAEADEAEEDTVEVEEAEDPQEPDSEEGSGLDYIDELAAAGYSKLSVEQLIAMRNHGVTGEYVRALAAAGYKNLSVDDVVTMAVHGVNAEYIRGLAAAGYANLTGDAIVSMRIHGVDPDYVRELASLGYTKLSAEDLVGMAVHGVGAAYVQELKAAGYANVPLDSIVALKVQGVSGEYVRAMAASGFPSLSIEDLISMKVQGVSPSYVRDLAALGYAKLSTDEIISLRVQGVSGNYIREIKDLGYSPSVEELIGMRVQGVSGKYIRSLKERGFDKLTIDQIIRLRIAGIK